MSFENRLIKKIVKPISDAFLILFFMSQAVASEPNEQLLQRFVKAEQAVQQVRSDYWLALAKEQAEKGTSEWTQAAMLIEMGKVIEAEGLTLEDYNQLAKQMADDANLRKRIETMEAAAPTK